jgi:hypothetical protein
MLREPLIGVVEMVNITLVSYAILKANWDHRQSDYIGSFMPFLIEAIRAAPSDALSLHDLQARMTEVFGLKLPFNSLKTLINRANRHGYVRVDRGVYFRNLDRLPDTSFPAKRERVLRQINAIVEAFKSYCEETHSVTLSEEDAESALHRYFSRHCDVLLSASLEGSPIPEPSAKVRGSRFLAGSFIYHISRKEPVLFDYVEAIVKGTVLANALMYQDIGKVQQHFRSVDVFFDTPFLLTALGLSSQEAAAPCRELLDLLYLEGARLRCFDHTYREVVDVLDSFAHRLRTGTYPHQIRPTLQYLLAERWRPSDVVEFIGTLERRLAGLRVSVVQRPPYRRELGIDESALREKLMAYVGYDKEESLQRDVDSLTAIYRSRGGRPSLQLEVCKAIFVTPNVDLVRASLDFFSGEHVTGNAPLAITDVALTHLVWLKRPTAAPQLPRKLVVANCYAALEPGVGLWKRYLETITELKGRGAITEEQYLVLRYSLDAREALMNLTLGESSAFVEGTVDQVLRRAEAQYREEARLHAKREMDLLRSELDEAKRERDKVRSKVTLAGNRIGWFIGFAAFWLVVALMGLSYFVTRMWLPDPFPLMVFVICAAITVVETGLGVTAASLRRRLEVGVARTVTKWILALFGLDMVERETGEDT